MPDFIGEEDALTFEGWLTFQGVDGAALTPDELATWHDEFDEAMERRRLSPKVGRMNLRLPGEYRYAVALRDGEDLWLTLWIKRSAKGDFYIFQPRADGEWNPHTSYHHNGRVHSKSYDHVALPRQQRQPLTGGTFRGCEHLGTFGGHAPKTIGAICDPADFTGVFEIAPGMVGARHGSIAVDLVEPGCQPANVSPTTVIDTRVFDDTNPNVIIRVLSYPDPRRCDEVRA